MSTKTDGLMNEEHWQRVRAAQVTQPSQTDDLEAKAREWWISKFPTADPDTDAARFEFKMLMDFHEHARSLAQPPSSEVAERIMEAITEVLQDSYGDDVLDWIERSAYRDKDSGITQRIEAKLLNP
jgi:hypothetical protein